MKPRTRRCHSSVITSGIQHAPLSRRQCVRGVLQSGAFIAALAMRRGSATEVATATPSAIGDTLLFPEGLQLPAGLTLQSSGTRYKLSELAGTFRNPRDAAQLLSSWGWMGNVYRSYGAGPGAGSATPARLELSLHQFRFSTGAAYALPYFAHDRAVALHRQEEPFGLLLPCEATVVNDGSATRYLRRRNLLVRVTVVMPWPGDANAAAAALSIATNLALAVLVSAGGDSPPMTALC